MSKHADALGELDKQQSIRERLIALHKEMKNHFPFIDRIAIALYDPHTRALKTYIHSSGDRNPLSNYQTSIDNAPKLKAILKSGRPRVVNNPAYYYEGNNHIHSIRVRESGYSASYTVPMYNNNVFFGFLFFNSLHPNVFSEESLAQIDVYAHLISTMVVNELASIRTLAAAVKTSRNITHLRDPETGAHLERMSRYSRLIASKLADQLSLNDDFIEHIFLYSPLHDIGKVAIPDNILLKKGALSREEKSLMQTHTKRGREMIDAMINNFGLESVGDIDVLRNIAELHHEALDGSGYPHGLRHEEIPLEARIVTVADVFDALTSERPYKSAWSNDEAVSFLKQSSGKTLDSDCVAALFANIESLLSIQEQFQEDTLG